MSMIFVYQNCQDEFKHETENVALHKSAVW